MNYYIILMLTKIPHERIGCAELVFRVGAEPVLHTTSTRRGGCRFVHQQGNDTMRLPRRFHRVVLNNKQKSLTWFSRLGFFMFLISAQ